MFKKLIFSMLLGISGVAFANNTIKKDSLETEFKDNLVYVLHKVEAGQTLYSLLNKYNCSINEVMVLNPSLNNQTSIQLGQKLKFPLIKNGKHVSATAYTKNLNVISEKPKENTNTKYNDKQLHIVKAGETVYSISKLYGLSTIELTDANGIFEYKISLGQNLLIDKKEILLLLKPVPIEKPTELPFEKLNKSKLITHEGLAEVINTKNRTNKFLALHRYAPVGSIIKVTNEATGKSIKARVVGNLNEVGPDHDILVKLSPYAFSQLNPKDYKLRAKVNYYE